MQSRRRAYIFVPLFVVLCALAAGFFNVGAVSAANPSEDAARDQSAKSFTRFTTRSSRTSPTRWSPTRPSTMALSRACCTPSTRTPTSSIRRNTAKLREDQSGRYFGIGMMVGPRNGRTIVKSPFSGSPAFKAGLRPGDVIIEVNDKKTDTLSTSEVAELLKGPRGTQVQVVVQREGVDKPMTFNIVRDEIPRSSVPYAMLLKNGIAYITITAFNENTGKEFDDKLKKLDEKNLKGLGAGPARQSRRPAQRRRRRGRPLPEEERDGGQPPRPHRRARTRNTRPASKAPARIIQSWCW